MRIFLLTAVACVSAGCTNHPLVDDVTAGEYPHLSTYDIVNKIRCEAREKLEEHRQSDHFKEMLAAGKAAAATLNGMAKDVADRQKEVTAADARAAYAGQQSVRLYHRTKWIEHRLVVLPTQIERKIGEAKAWTDRTLPPESAQDRFRKEQVAQILGSIKEMLATYDRLKDEHTSLAALVEEVVRQEVREEKGKTAADKERSEAQKRVAALEMEKARSAPFVDFDSTNIAMQFRFEITETDNGSSDGSIKWPIHLGTATIGFSAGKNKIRLSERWVAISMNFGDLHNVNTCHEARMVARDDKRARIYPITGRIGIGELIGEYLDIIEDDARFKATKTKDGVYSDRLLFTTTINGGVTPSVALNPGIAELKLNGNFGASRKDVHEVIVDIAPSQPDKGADKTQMAVALTSAVEVPVRLSSDPIDDIAVPRSAER